MEGQTDRFAVGDVAEKELLHRAVQGMADAIRGQLCEAYYYAGRARLVRSDRVGARDLFQKSIDTGVKSAVEYEGSERLLAKLDSRP